MADESLTKETLEELLGIAREAAHAGAIVHQNAKRGVIEAQMKTSHSDLVTEIDREAEQRIVSAIRAWRPLDAIIGEEGTQVAGSSDVCWVIDPLDGTTNFVHGYPAHAVSVGVEIGGRRMLGVVHDTFHDCVYSGIVGRGAKCDDLPINARTETDLSRALIGTGFLPDAEVRLAQADILRNVLPQVRDLRRSGCPSLDLCAVAAGKLDGFYEYGLGRWDIAAGAAIAEAAGAKVIELHSHTLPDPLLVVANAQLSEALVVMLVGSEKI